MALKDWLKRSEPNSPMPKIPPRSRTAYNSDLALTLGAIFRGVQIIATPLSKMPLLTYRYVESQNIRIDNPLLINKPSLLKSRREFIFETVVSLALDGGAIWIKTLDQSDNPIDLTLVPYNAVGMDWIDPYDIRKGIRYTYAGKTYDQKEIQHLRFFIKPGQIRGLSPLRTASKDVLAAIELRDYAADWFNKEGVPTGIISSQAFINEDQGEEITRRWHEKQSERKVAVFGNGVSYQRVALSPKEALFTEVQEQQIQGIARLLGIPPRLLVSSIPGGSNTYTNLQDENQVFYRHTLMAYTDPIADALSECLPRGNTVDFDFEHLFKADTLTRYQSYKLGIDSGFLTDEYVKAKETLNA